MRQESFNNEREFHRISLLCDKIKKTSCTLIKLYILGKNSGFVSGLFVDFVDELNKG